MSLLEEMALWFISTLSMIMALLLVYQIFVEFFNLTLPNHSGIPFLYNSPIPYNSWFGFKLPETVGSGNYDVFDVYCTCHYSNAH